MIDLHCHILSGLDDGAKTLEESLQMCLLSYRDGVRTIVATPHILKGIFENNRGMILSKVLELEKAIKEFGVFGSEVEIQSKKMGSKDPFKAKDHTDQINQKYSKDKIDLRIFPGADVHFSEDLLSELESGHLITVGDGGKFIFIEFPFQSIPYGAEGILFQLLARGIIPIITHPERNLEVAQRPKRYYEMIRMGCLGQVTAMSLTGEFGPRVREVAERLLRHNLFHFIASDAHSVNGRPPFLSSAVKSASRIVGKEEALRMVTDYPQAILNGKRPDFREPLTL